MSTLKIDDLHVTIDTEGGPVEILKGVSLTLKEGETHAIMGPNGSGKSTLAYTIAGHPRYEVTGGSITLDGEDVLEMSPDERAKAGLFLAMQYPVEVPGVSMSNFLRAAAPAVRREATAIEASRIRSNTFVPLSLNITFHGDPPPSLCILVTCSG